MSYTELILAIAIILIIVLIIFGTCGYHFVIGLNWIDSFFSACLTVTGLSLEIKRPIIKTSDKIFIALFVVLSIISYTILIAAIISTFLSPIISYYKKISDESTLSQFHI